MATLDSSQQVSNGFQPQLDEFPANSSPVKSNAQESKSLDQEQEQVSSFSSIGATGYGGMSEQEPPRHKIHTDAEPLPKPTSNSFADDEPNNTEAHQDAVAVAPPSHESADVSKPSDDATESYQDARATEPESVDEGKPDQDGAANGGLYDRSSFGNIGRGQEKSSSLGNGTTTVTNGSTHADVIPQASTSPTEANVTDRGYGNDQEVSEPELESANDPVAKKEGFIAKMMEKLPGHHHKTADTATDNANEELFHEDNSSAPANCDTTSRTPTKSLMAKIKEKLPGHHATATHVHANAAHAT